MGSPTAMAKPRPRVVWQLGQTCPYSPWTWWKVGPVWRGTSSATSSCEWTCTSCSQGALHWKWRRLGRADGGARCWRECYTVWPGCTPAWTSTAAWLERASPSPPSRLSLTDLWTWNTDEAWSGCDPVYVPGARCVAQPACWTGMYSNNACDRAVKLQMFDKAS